MSTLSITYLNAGGVITNYNCVSRCGHCLYNCGPHRPNDYLDTAMAERIFSRILELGCRSVHIGGGEPLLAPQKLTQIALVARSTGVAVDYVETNSAWFFDAQRAEAVLENLQAAGVGTLLVSISPFHNAFIPYSRVKGVIQACRRTGMQVFPWVNAFVKDLSRLDDTRPHTMEEFETLFGPDYLARIPDRYWIHPGGRALKTFRTVHALKPVDEIIGKSPASCAGALSDTSHFHIDLYGNYIPGLCSGLAIAMQDLGGPLPDGKYLLIENLAKTGIRGLCQYAVDTIGYRPQGKSFINHCDLCTDIRRTLLRHDDKRFPELAPKEFYNGL